MSQLQQTGRMIAQKLAQGIGRGVGPGMMSKFTNNVPNYKGTQKQPVSPVPSKGSQYLKGFKKGGNVKKTGNYKLHKGETVVRKKRFNKSKFEAAKKEYFKS
jgi:hypothetical protein